ncbi:MAG TPA: hypothetical protein VGF52_03285 [Tepidisphaeraceae bacterium]|jgi:predicted nuclease of predicted toxin-antitoxin system
MSVKILIDMNLSPAWTTLLRQHGWTAIHWSDVGDPAGPSVFQVRAQNVLPDHLGGIVVAALRQHENDLLAGALVTVDENKSRIRVLPI